MEKHIQQSLRGKKNNQQEKPIEHFTDQDQHILSTQGDASMNFNQC